MLYFDLSPVSQPAPPIPSEEDLQGIPTLIIDDNATNRTILSELTRQWKMKPQMCDSGESGTCRTLQSRPLREILTVWFCSMNRCPGSMGWQCSSAFAAIPCSKVLWS